MIQIKKTKTKYGKYAKIPDAIHVQKSIRKCNLNMNEKAFRPKIIKVYVLYAIVYDEDGKTEK